MKPSVYIIGGAGTGKSTFMQEVLNEIGELGDLTDIHKKKVTKNVVTLRGHLVRNAERATTGLYLGVLRESFPGTDGLDRVSSPVGVDWLYTQPLPDFIVAEGATLATRPFLIALNEKTELLIIHLRADDFVKELRFQERGSAQPESFVKSTETRSLNLYNDMRKTVQCADVDTADPEAWAWARHTVLTHLGY